MKKNNSVKAVTVMQNQIELLELEIRNWSLLITKQSPTQTLAVIKLISEEVDARVKKVEWLKAQFGFA